VNERDHLAKKPAADAFATPLDAQPAAPELSTLDPGAAVAALTPPPAPRDVDATLGAIAAPPEDLGATIGADHVSHPEDPGATFVDGNSPSARAAEPVRRASGPETIGPYKLIKTLGEGGMGQVWLAEQTKPVRRQVALKIIKGGLYDEAVIQRFEAERQSLAIMDHPAIAKVFDAGTADGHPYFVMEYVPGKPVTQFCDERKLTPRERLKLFIKICEGVQHAHQKAVIHRDLKPTNILISEIDGKPAPHIIDFGIAKATTPGAEQTLLTQVGSFVGTPGYMSPEQANSDVQDIDTRTDVYALGVILYELLTGCLTFDVKTWQGKGLHEILRQIREDDPARPSAKLKTDPATLETAARERSVEPKQLIHQISGDLDWITMKALEKDRARRYDSPIALAADIERYLHDEPVLASPPSATYRAQKFVRRHRVGVAAAAAVALMIVVLAGAMTVQAIRIARERDRANEKAAEAASALNVMTGLFKVSDPSEARGNSITVREILDKAPNLVESSLGGQPKAQAQMLDTLGTVYEGLGLYAPAQDLFQKSLDTRNHVLGPQNPDTLASESDLATDLRHLGQYPAAEKLQRQALEAQRVTMGPNNPATLTTMVQLATTLGEEGHRPEQESLLRDALEKQRRVMGPENADTLKTMNNLADTLRAEGKYADAEQLWRQVLDVQKRTLGVDHPDTMRTSFNIAADLAYEGHLADAEAMQRDTLEMRQRVLGLNHADTLATMDNLANILLAEKRLSDSETLRRQTLVAEQRVLGPEHPWTLFTMSELANTLSVEGRFPEAEKLLEQTLEIQRRTSGPDSPKVAGTEYNLACNAALAGKSTEAISYLSAALNHGLSRGTSLHMEKDSDLKSLHGDPRFTALVAQVHRNFPQN